MLKSENVVVIHGWMCNELELKGNELLVFALIYGFSCDGVSSFFGGRKYIAETFNISLPTVDKALNGLLNKELICKDDREGFTDVYFYDEKGVKKLYRGCKETLHNNINKNKKINKNISKDILQDVVTTEDNLTKLNNKLKSKGKNLYQKCLDLINDFTNDEDLRHSLTECFKLFSENSRDAGMPFYANNFKGKLNTLAKLSTDTEMQIKIVQQTLDNGWQNFYAIKGDTKRRSSRYTTNEPTDMGYVVDRADRRNSISGEKF